MARGRLAAADRRGRRIDPRRVYLIADGERAEPILGLVVAGLLIDGIRQWLLALLTVTSWLVIGTGIAVVAVGVSRRMRPTAPSDASGSLPPG